MSEGIRIRKLDHVVIRARDPERMIAFYCDVLGCTLEKRSTVVTGLTHLRAGDSLIDIQAAGEGAPMPAPDLGNMDHLCIQVEPYSEAEITDHLQRHGVEVGSFGPRFSADGDATSIYIRDPEGNEVELKEPPD
jgi:glyoxylase I family protein